MTPPTQGETFTKLLHHLRECEDASAMLSHLAGLNDDDLLCKGWLAVHEQFKKQVGLVTKLALGSQRQVQ